MTLSPAPFHQLAGSREIPAEAFWVRSDDDIRLRVVLWRASAPHATVLLFPGRTEYAEKYAPVAKILTESGLNVITIDWRGQGLADRLQDNTRPGHIRDFTHYQLDAVALLETAAQLDLPEPWHLLGHSMGGAIGLAALHNGLPVASASFSAPMWGINHAPMPHAVVMAIAKTAGRFGRGGHAAMGTGGNGTYVLDEAFQNNLLTENVDAWTRLVHEAVEWPEMTLGGASYDWLAAALTECRRLAALPAPDLPMLVALGSHELVVSSQAIRLRAASWDGAKLLRIEGGRHEILFGAPERQAQFYDAFFEHIATADLRNPPVWEPGA